MKPKEADIRDILLGAGKILREGYGKEFKVERKGEIDLVTEIDKRSEDYLVRAIQRRFPEHQIITEERGHIQGDDNRIWYIDPLDGTINYAHGVPIFSVTIAFAVHGKVNIGGVYDPMQDEYFFATRGGGAYLNGRRLMVSDVTSLDKSLLVTGFPYDVQINPENNLNHYVNFTKKSRGVRRLGSAAIDLAYVAAGRFDGYWEISIGAWDIAAGSLIVEEARGEVTDVRGGPDYLSPSPSILATNAKIHQEMLAVLGGNRPDDRGSTLA
jgi:myo-inositol-1(or 4)-monophosphatase